jgi:Mg2+/Co2+ transporter CorC
MLSQLEEEDLTEIQLQVKQMATMLQENTGLKHQLANAQGQLQEILAKKETDANELKKSFCEATLEGEVQVLKAQASESMILRSQVAELEHKLRESDTKEHLHVCFKLQTSNFVLIFWQNLLLLGLLHIDLSLDIHVLICHEEINCPSLPIVLSVILLLHLLSYWPHLIMV